MMNSPNSASANALGLSLHHNMDMLMNDQAIPFDLAYHTMYNLDTAAKTYPFHVSTFPTAPSANFYEPTYLLDDIHKFQVQLYQELRYQVARQDLQKDLTFGSGYPDEFSMSGGSTIDTPLVDTSVLSLPEIVQPTSTEYPAPYVETPQLEAKIDDKPSPPPKPIVTGVPTSKVQKKRVRHHIMARSRSGCWICRIKHLKCDECKPVCANCTRFGIQCDYSAERPDYVSNKELRRQKLDSLTTKKRRTTTRHRKGA